MTMIKFVDGKVVEVASEERETRELEMAEGRAEALQQAKDFLITKIDERLDTIQRDSRLPNEKRRIRLATSREEALSIFNAIRWPLMGAEIPLRDERPSGGQISSGAHGGAGASSGGGSAGGSVPTIIERVVVEKPIIERTTVENPYDDVWIREQLSAFAENLSDHGQRLESLETKWKPFPATLPAVPPVAEQAKPLSIRDAMKRVEEIEQQEAGIDPADLPPIEIEPPAEQSLDAGNWPPREESPVYTGEPIPIAPVIVPEKPQPEQASGFKPITPKDLPDGPPPLYEQIRYEIAMMAVNGNTDAQLLLQDEARLRGVAVLTLAHKIIDVRRELEKEVMRYYARLQM